MSDVKFTVGGAMEDEASHRFIDAWHRAERGETLHELHLAFESGDALARILNSAANIRACSASLLVATCQRVSHPTRALDARV